MSENNPIIVERAVATSDGRVLTYHYYWCPGCDALHGITVNPSKNSRGAGWNFSGTLECPTYAPSQLSRAGAAVCHSFIRAGQIEFLSDCTHGHKGRTVPLPPLPDWVLRFQN